MRTGSGESTTSPVRDADLVGPRTERDLRRFEAYCRWSLHTLILLAGIGLLTVAFIGVWHLAGPKPVWTVAAAVAILGWTGLGIALTERLCREESVPRPVVVTFAVFALAVTFGFDALIPPGAHWDNGASTYIGFGPLGLAGTAAISSLTRRLRPVLTGTGAGLAALALLYRFGPPHLPLAHSLALTTMAFWLCVLCIPTMLATRWMIDVVRRLWRSRQVAADLAVAEERLRFSRDLHDVFGRTLSAVTVKSELAAELARRGDARAVDEMESVREIAQSALGDVRGLVRGYRHIDLAGELAGARGVLRAAGLRPVLSGSVDEVTARVSQPAAEALAWVVREGITNVLRHGRGSEVRIDVANAGDAVELRIENDAAPRSSQSTGTGLVGLRERVEAAGGTLTAGRAHGTFRLEARLPT